MLFCKIEGKVAVEFPIEESTLRQELSTTLLPGKLNNDILNPLGYAVLEELDPTTLPQVTCEQVLVLSGVEYVDPGTWKRIYSLSPIDSDAAGNRMEKKWKEVRDRRDGLLDAADKRISRYHRQVRLGIDPIDDLETLDVYMQALADITDEPDPFVLQFPTVPKERSPDEVKSPEDE